MIATRTFYKSAWQATHAVIEEICDFAINHKFVAIHKRILLYSSASEVSLNFKTKTEIFRANALNMTKKFSSLRDSRLL
ncbi:hypothetical protein [Helicobacter sp. T3_23-1056]